jgi:predicted amidohydrolase
LELDKGTPYNTFVLYNKKGELMARYRKMHLFRLLKEEQYLGEGNEIVTADTFWGKIGLSICYDLRFPEIYRALALRGSRLVLVVAEWPERRVDHWDILLRARAIENQFFIAAVNKVGESKGVELGGHSVILDPWGKEIVYGSDHDILLTGELDMDEVNQARQWIPVFDDRRPGLYGLDS